MRRAGLGLRRQRRRLGSVAYPSTDAAGTNLAVARAASP